MSQAKYGGRDRRLHRMFVTRNTEYHFRGRTCIAVRDLKTGKWLSSHLALNRTLSGAIRFRPGAAVPMLTEPRVGEALYFGEDGRELVTSVLCAIDRPDKTLVSMYPALSA